MDIEQEMTQLLQQAKEAIPSVARDVVADIVADRKKQHGDFTDHAEYSQRLKTVLHSSPNWSKMRSTQREGLEMIAHKIGRILAGDPDHADHWLDIEGYTRITRERL